MRTTPHTPAVSVETKEKGGFLIFATYLSPSSQAIPMLSKGCKGPEPKLFSSPLPNLVGIDGDYLTHKRLCSLDIVFCS